MSTLHVAKVALTVVVRVDRHVLDRHLVASPAAVGEQLAQQVDDYTWRERLGYYPALGFFEGRSGVDPDLLRAAKDIAWFVGALVEEEMRRRLRAVFARVGFRFVQAVAFTMPSVRPRQPSARQALARHYTPDTVKLTVEVACLERRVAPSMPSTEQHAREELARHLKGRFASLHVTSARML